MRIAVAATDGAAGVTVTSLDVANDFTHVVTAAGAFTASNAVDVAHTLGDALTISDGTNTNTFYRVAANAARRVEDLHQRHDPADRGRSDQPDRRAAARSSVRVNGTGVDFCPC